MKHPVRQRHVKIVATLGPASWEPENLAALCDAGADVFRFNMSHLDKKTMKRLHGDIRALEQKRGEAIAILLDLQGPKLRTGKMPKGGVMLKAGQHIRLDKSDAEGSDERIPLPHKEVFDVLKPDAILLIDDGRLRLKVESIAANGIEAVVEVGGKLTSRKGINLPGVRLPIPALTKKDRDDLTHALELGVDWVALSFVQGPEDMDEARKLIGDRAALMAKIERPAALESLPEILDRADGLMVARGDLGVELPVQKIPGLQKRITRQARRAGKPVVVATQMLESMITTPVPTRAEVSDVAIAVFEGADAVMLSAETAAGKYPVESVETMNKVAMQVETEPTYQGIIHAQRLDPEPTTPDAIAAASRTVADTLGVVAIICYTTSGSTALRVARERPQIPIFAFTPSISTVRRLALVWGVHCLLTADAQSFDDLASRACRLAIESGRVKEGDLVVITAGVPFGTPGATNLLWVTNA